MLEIRAEGLAGDLVGSLRRNGVILLLDRLTRAASTNPATISAATWDKVAKAAQSYGLVDVGDGEQIRSIVDRDGEDWRALVSIIEHQLSYLRILEAGFDSRPAAEPTRVSSRG